MARGFPVSVLPAGGQMPDAGSRSSRCRLKRGWLFVLDIWWLVLFKFIHKRQGDGDGRCVHDFFDRVHRIPFRAGAKFGVGIFLL